ncbi:MAG: alpha-hydroxy-acid oxidizing protein [Dehalococcoidia bacterium]|nr:alpha-hydroxy-acid oxidizing protein [Dehalococcoidia bacterium]
MPEPTPPGRDLLNVLDYETAAHKVLPPMARDYYASGAHDEVTLRANRAAFERVALRYHVLRGVEVRDTSVELLGRRHPVPLLIAPAAFGRLAHPDGELAVARAAAAAGITQTLSTLSTCSIEAVAEAGGGGPRWFQLYVFRDREVTRDLVQRAEAAGYEALVLTVDAPVLGYRDRDARNRFELPEGLAPESLSGALAKVQAEGAASGLFQYFAALIDPSLTWDDVDWLLSVTRLPVLLKGVVRGDDATLAVEHGAAGVIVSNHGGRQLDGAVASLDALSEVAAAVDGQAAVLVDGGVRRGTDILKALALGADAVLVGRPVLWGLAVAGEAGVRHVLELLSAEFDLAMALCGVQSVEEITRDLVAGRQ